MHWLYYMHWTTTVRRHHAHSLNEPCQHWYLILASKHWLLMVHHAVEIQYFYQARNLYAFHSDLWQICYQTRQTWSRVYHVITLSCYHPQISCTQTRYTAQHFNPHINHLINNVKKSKVLLDPHWPTGQCWSLSPVALSRSYKTTDTWLVHLVYTCLLPSFHRYILTDPGEMARWVGIGTHQPRAGFQPGTSRSLARHHTTRPRHTVIN